jgi:glycerate dehydrogenase
VTNIPAYGTASVAQHTMALLLELTNHVGRESGTVADGRWQNSPDFCYWDDGHIELTGKVMGIVGYGRIGRAVAGLARAFGMDVVAYTRTPPKGTVIVSDASGHADVSGCARGAALEVARQVCEPASVAGAADVRFVGCDELLACADVVSLHCPLTDANFHMIDAGAIAAMKPGALLINTARGALIDDDALAAALESGEIGGAALDTLAEEPPRGGDPLIGAKNCIVTPHVAWATHEARSRLMDIAGANLRSYLEGKPQNVVRV